VCQICVGTVSQWKTIFGQGYITQVKYLRYIQISKSD
jgi:hypothetical protein